MWCGADHKEGSDGSDTAGCYPMEIVKGPATLSTQRTEEVLFLYEAPGAYGELEVCRPSPDGGNNGED